MTKTIIRKTDDGQMAVYEESAEERERRTREADEESSREVKLSDDQLAFLRARRSRKRS
jgi:hypothetical protein